MVIKMESKIFKVLGMSCQHCVSSVTKGLAALNGVTDVAVSLSNKTVTVTFDAKTITTDRITKTIEDLGYDVTH